MQSCDVVIVGGGIAGSALATALARDGREVTVLEASEVYEDRVRGESMQPWGVAEARELGVEQTLLDAGAHIARTWLHFDADVPLEVTVANPLPVGMIIPGVDGSLNLRHPDACSALNSAAVAAGATVHRGVQNIEITPGSPARVTCDATGSGHLDLTARLVVGADGRTSAVRRQAGISLSRQEEAHMVSGLLVEGLTEVPDEQDFIASEDDLFMASFFQGGGRLRVYLCPAKEQRHRFSGPGGLEEFRRSAAFRCIPFGEALATAEPAGPLATYPGDESWTERPYAEGVVLIGDAAGFNNPIIGQGLSIALRDARTVRDLLRAGTEPAAAGLDAYATERLERMRRLRAAADFTAAALATGGPDRKARRARYFQLQQTEPLFLGLASAVFGGPETAPPEALDGRLIEMLRQEA